VDAAELRRKALASAQWQEMNTAFRNRQELFRAGLMNRRDLFRLGLLTGAGLLVPKRGLSAWAQWSGGGSYGGSTASPPTTPWTMAMPIMPVKQPIAVSALSPAPTIAPNTAINAATGRAYEGRTRTHQAPALGFRSPPRPCIRSPRRRQVQMSNQLPAQTIWG
jgi:hypothetical protein